MSWGYKNAVYNLSGNRGKGEWGNSNIRNQNITMRFFMKVLDNTEV